jgi:hypothetical protein
MDNQNRYNILAIVLLSMFISACAVQPSYKAESIRSVYPPMVKDCTFVGSVVGESTIPWLRSGEIHARYMAQDRAAEIGATDIVWTEFENGFKPIMRGRAYRCSALDRVKNKGC